MKRGLKAAACVALAVLGAGVGGCSTNEATGRSQLVLLSRDWEIQTGLEAAPQMTEEYGGVVADAGLRQYVTNLGMRLKAETEGENAALPWEFFLLDSEVINAFALPGGKVFMSRGLAERMTNEAQLAGVLGHEIGHVTARHGNERVSQQLVAAGVVSAVAVGASASDSELVAQGLPYILSAGSGVFLLKYSRDQESEADYLGMRYMSRVGYNPIGQLQVMEILKAAAGSDHPPEFLATHPLPDTRIERIRALLASEEFAATQNNPNYQLFEERFRREFLTPLNALPRPRQARGVDGGDGCEAPGFSLARAETWCGHCAAAAREHARAN